MKSVSHSIEWLLVDWLYPEENCPVVPKTRVLMVKYEDIARLFTYEMAARNDDATKAAAVQKK